MAETPRREFLKLAIAGALAAASGTLDAARAHAESLGPAAPFAPENVLNMARGLAKSPFKAPRSTLPDPFNNLTFEQYTSIRRIPGSAIWGDVHGGFALEPLNRGFIFATPMELNLVEGGQSQHVLYDRNLYDFGKLQLPADLGDLGFSGVRILSGGFIGQIPDGQRVSGILRVGPSVPTHGARCLPAESSRDLAPARALASRRRRCRIGSV